MSDINLTPLIQLCDAFKFAVNAHIRADDALRIAAMSVQHGYGERLKTERQIAQSSTGTAKEKAQLRLADTHAEMFAEVFGGAANLVEFLPSGLQTAEAHAAFKASQLHTLSVLTQSFSNKPQPVPVG